MHDENAPYRIQRARPIAPLEPVVEVEPDEAPPEADLPAPRRFRSRIVPAVVDLTSSEVYVLASAIAFNALLSFFPFVIILLVLCRNILRWPEGYEAVLYLLHDHYLPISADFITRNLRAVVETKYAQAAAVSLGTLLFTSAGVFAPVEMALNRAWGVTEARSFVRNQLTAMSLVIGCGALALGSVYISAYTTELLRASMGAAAEWAPIKLVSSMALRVLIFPVTVAIFFLVYYVLPNRRMYVRKVLPIAIFTGLLWEISKYLFMWLAPKLNFQNVYGPFYITVTLVTWAYISALILLLGANLASVEPRTALGRKR